MAAVVVMGDDTDLISRSAAAIARGYWDARDEFAFVAPAGTLQECLVKACDSSEKPFLISDSGDNPTAGGAGDTSFTLGELLRALPKASAPAPAPAPTPATSPAPTLYASILDPVAALAMRDAGVGGCVTVQLGGHIDSGPAGPVEASGTVAALDLHDEVGGVVGVLRTGPVDVIVTERRKPYHHLADFTDLGLDPRRADLVVVKIGYLEPELYALAADWMLALTPGGVDQDLLRLPYHHVRRPIYPLDPAMDTPDLSPTLL